MSAEEKLKTTHDVAEGLQRKLEGMMTSISNLQPYENIMLTVGSGLADVERAFVHVDYDGIHDIGEEHKPLYDMKEAKEPLLQRVKSKMRFKGRVATTEVTTSN